MPWEDYFQGIRKEKFLKKLPIKCSMKNYRNTAIAQRPREGQYREICDGSVNKPRCRLRLEALGERARIGGVGSNCRKQICCCADCKCIEIEKIRML